MNEQTPVLTPGEWHALEFQVPDQVRHLVIKLAIHHGVMEPPTPAECPLCNAKRKPQQMPLGGSA
jgi:hypothetical protein